MRWEIKTEPCERCAGRGADEGTGEPCSDCLASGEMPSLGSPRRAQDEPETDRCWHGVTLDEECRPCLVETYGPDYGDSLTEREG